MTFLLAVTAAVAFCAGFCAAALVGCGRRQDSWRGNGLLAQSVGSFTSHYSDRSGDVGGQVSIPRVQLDELDAALNTRDELLAG
jgi:hypothetical protein